jgi:Secretion system C-terminal sorting domain
MISKFEIAFKHPSNCSITWVFFLISQFISLGSKAQLEGTQWTFGDSAYIDFKNPENPIVSSSAMDNRGSCSSIADSAGNLLFYCGQISGAILTECSFVYKQNQVYTKEHIIMENGNCLEGTGWYDEHTIIPMPGNDSLYYIFSIGGILTSGLYYQVVNINGNNGLGSVIETNHPLIVWDEFEFDDDDHLIFMIKAVRHANGRDWWIVTKAGGVPVQYYDDEPNVYYLFLVTSQGITEFTQSSIEIRELAFPGCNIGFNQEGNRMYYNCDNLVVLDFDRCTGEISNYQVIDSGGFDLDKFYWSAEFSYNGKYLYAIQMPKSADFGSIYYLLQYDLQSSNPALTKDTLSIFGPEFFTNPDTSFIDVGALRLAPDNKIYTSQFYNNGYYNWPWPDSIYNEVNMNLSVINYPDSAYPACQFEPFSFGLGGKRTYGGLPNNPNYNLSAIDGSPCDTLGITGLTKRQSYLKNQLNIFPNPCHNFCVLEYKPAKKAGTILITDAQGKIIFKEENIPVTLLQHGYELNLSAFKNGVYTMVLTSGEVRVSSNFVRL